ncbi:unnamed protein product [Effrenium voratum]|nr:unnamed protein product [Effrenium voratum]
MWPRCVKLMVLVVSSSALALEAGVLHAFPPAPSHHVPKFRIRDQFTAKVFTESFVGINSGWIDGILIYDATLERYNLRLNSVLHSFDNFQMNYTRFATKDTMMERIQDACTNFSTRGAGFSGLFQMFALHGLHLGRSQVNGTECDLYHMQVPSVFAYSRNMSLCIQDGNSTAGGLPLQLVGSDQRHPHMTFHDFKGSVDKEQLQVPDACRHLPKPCGDGAVLEQRIYLAHPRSRYNISGQDVADARGDAVFMCFDMSMASAGNYSLVSSYDLQILRNFSQYTNYPPSGKGFGGDDFHVGRQVPLAIGRHSGQCEDDKHWQNRIGQWFSLSPDGQCSPGGHLGKDCAWRIRKRVATIELSCLYDRHGLKDICHGAVAPFEAATMALLRALDSEDDAKGGCPRVRDAECAAHPACAFLQGDCCPHADGVMLACCNQSFELIV